MRTASRLIAAATIALSATAYAQEPQTPPPLPSAMALPPAPQIDDPQLAPPPTAPKTLASWDEALGMIRTLSPDYRATFDAIRRAEAQTTIAMASILPTIYGQGSYTHQVITQAIPTFGTYPPPNVLSAQANLIWTPIDPRAWHAMGTADVAVEAAKDDLVEKRRTIAQSVVNAMLATLAAERVAELNRVGLRAALERLTLAQAKAKYGSGTALDIDRAQQDVAAARALVLSGDESLRQSREALGLALGSHVAIAAPGDLALDRFEQTVAATCHVNDDVEKRSDVVAAKTRLRVAERNIDDQWLRAAPTLGLQSQFLWASEVAFGPPATWSLGAVLTVPIFQGGSTMGYIRDARAQADQARESLTAARLAALVNVTQASRAVSVTQAERDVAQAQRDLAARIDQRTREGYLHGLGTSLDLVTSAQALRQAEINLVLLQFQHSQARVQSVLANAECIY